MVRKGMLYFVRNSHVRSEDYQIIIKNLSLYTYICEIYLRQLDCSVNHFIQGDFSFNMLRARFEKALQMELDMNTGHTAHE